MGKTITLRKGFNIPLTGKAATETVETPLTRLFAVKPADFHGLYMPKPLVEVGERVKAGTPLFADKQHPEICFASPVSGEVVEVNRGEKRKLLDIRVLSDSQMEYVSFERRLLSDIQQAPLAELREQLLSSGAWANIVQRPFGILADPAASPKAIHISMFDTAPLAPDWKYMLAGQEDAFQAGVEVLKRFSKHIHINVPKDNPPTHTARLTGIEVNQISCIHPAGCVGVQIHHIDPINKGDVVWTISPFGVVQIGKLFLHGIYDASCLIALTGSEVQRPRYYKTYVGASVEQLLKGNLYKDHVRIVSGNALTGKEIGAKGFVGFFDRQVTVLPEGDHYEFLGWLTPTMEKLSFHRAWGLLSFLSPQKARALDTNMHGEHRAFVMTGAFEKVLPMDILPMHLFKSILANDIDAMEALGIYEVVEEDVALCEFIDVSKHSIQEIVRQGIDLVRTS